jgi:hypothetical protein
MTIKPHFVVCLIDCLFFIIDLFEQSTLRSYAFKKKARPSFLPITRLYHLRHLVFLTLMLKMS